MALRPFRIDLDWRGQGRRNGDALWKAFRADDHLSFEAFFPIADDSHAPAFSGNQVDAVFIALVARAFDRKRLESDLSDMRDLAAN